MVQADDDGKVVLIFELKRSLGLCLSAKLVHEGFVGDETILILSASQLVKHLASILLGDHVSQVAQDVLQLGQHHGAVLVLVVEFAELNEVMVIASVLGLF